MGSIPLLVGLLSGSRNLLLWKSKRMSARKYHEYWKTYNILVKSKVKKDTIDGLCVALSLSLPLSLTNKSRTS